MDTRMPCINNLSTTNYYASPVGVGQGLAAGGFEAHVALCPIIGSSLVNTYTDGGLAACGDGTDGWALSMDWDSADSSFIVNAYIGDSGGATVKISSPPQAGMLGKTVLASLCVTTNKLCTLYLNGAPVAEATLVGNFAPAPAQPMELGAVSYGFTPAVPVGYYGMAYRESTSLSSQRNSRFLLSQDSFALQQTRKMFAAVNFLVLTSPPGTGSAVFAYDHAWDGFSLVGSGARRSDGGSSRNIPPDTWLPQGGTESLTHQGANYTSMFLLEPVWHQVSAGL